jgi:FkbM family methyltransferase
MGVYEARETEIIKKYLREGMTFVDAGANVGYYTLLAASKVGEGGRVIAFEPSPYALERLLRTIESNCLTQVKTLPYALSDKSGEATLYAPVAKGHHSPTMIACEGVYPISIRAQTLDEFMDANAVDRVDVLKVDVEGFEPNVINGALRSIRQGKIKAVLCELNAVWLEANGWNMSRMMDLMTGLGFRIAASVNYSRNFSNVFYTHVEN